jgi:alkylation response protein AidB-like acyl-CoA dehydrogenase
MIRANGNGTMQSDEAFVAEVRAFVAGALPATVRDKVRRGAELTRDEYVAWLRALADRGWAAPAWPVAYGGCGWDARRRWLFEREMAAGWAPRSVNSGMFMLGPVLMRFGTDEQRARFLPAILRADDWWCQGFSEPNAGSDLASLRTTARLDGDHYVVNGEKVWVSYAQHATRMFFLARTEPDAKPQAGISFLTVAMDAPGVTRSPIETIDGHAEINAVAFEDVRIPVADRIGAPGAGWTCAKFLLAHERDVSADLPLAAQLVVRVRDAAREQPRERPGFAARLAEAEIRLETLWYAHLAANERDERDPDHAPPSYLKIASTEIIQELLRLLIDARGGALAPDDTASYLNGRKLSIYAGTNEIHRDLLARHLLAAS